MTARVDWALIGYVGVELGHEIATSPSVGIFIFILDHLQHT